MIGRRRFLSFIGAAPVAGPALAKQAMETIAGNLAGVSLGGVGGAAGGTFGGVAQAPSSAPPGLGINTEAMAAAMRVPALRDEITSLFFENNRAIGQIDHDIAVHRSFSLAAKITFQRQRQVDRAVDGWLGRNNSGWYERLHGIFAKVIGPFG